MAAYMRTHQTLFIDTHSACIVHFKDCSKKAQNCFLGSTRPKFEVPILKSESQLAGPLSGYVARMNVRFVQI